MLQQPWIRLWTLLDYIDYSFIVMSYRARSEVDNNENTSVWFIQIAGSVSNLSNFKSRQWIMRFVTAYLLKNVKIINLVQGKVLVA